MAFVVGYLVVWTVIGLVPLGVFLAFRDLSEDQPATAWLPRVSGLVLAEKNWRHGVLFNRVVGAAVAVLGCAVLLFPDLLGIVSGAPSVPASMSGM